MEINSTIKMYMLLLLAESPKHGYELMKRLELGQSRRVSASQVYPFLAALMTGGLISVKTRGGKDKKVYALTSKGRQFVDGVMGRFGELMAVALKKKISVCVHCGCRVYGSGHIEKIKGRKLVFCCGYCSASYRKGKGIK